MTDIIIPIPTIPKRCPYHGHCEVSVELDENPRAYRAVADCGASGPWDSNREAAVNYWNQICDCVDREAITGRVVFEEIVSPLTNWELDSLELPVENEYLIRVTEVS